MEKDKTLLDYDHCFPDGFCLETRRVELKVLQPSDYEGLYSLCGDRGIWTWFTRDLSGEGELKAWMKDAFQGRAAKTRVPFAIFDKDEKRIAGSTSYGNISFYDKRLEIGWTWLGTEFMRSGVNRHAKFLLLIHAFENLDMERVEAKTDVLNERSRAALLSIGMKPEGVLRNHMQMFNNRRRDSIYYSILKSEWPAVKQRYFGQLI